MFNLPEMALCVLVGYLAGLYTTKFIDFTRSCREFDRNMEQLRKTGEEIKEFTNMMRGEKDV